jgi:hypothetical protein
VTVISDVYRSAASRFLQSAIIVDDLPPFGPKEDETIPEMIEDPRPRPSPADPEAVKDAEELARAEEVKDRGRGLAAENRLDAEALTDRFAELGVVCGVLRLGSDVKVTSHTVLVAGERTDIVVLDWHLGDSGARALDLLNQLSDPKSRRLRLVCVYTGDGGVQVTTAIGALEGIRAVDGFRYQRGSTRIVLLFKEDAEQAGAPPERVINVVDLPGRLVEEFAELSAGLVSAAAMSALGAVREGTPEILGVLHPELDAAYVGQRLSQDRPDDALDQLAELIVSELQSIIEDDAEFATTADESAVGLWLERRAAAELTVEREALKQMNRFGGRDDMLTKIGESFEVFRGKKKRYPTEFIVADPAEAVLADARLAERMTTRHRYPGARPERLEFGVVVESPEQADPEEADAEEAEPRWWVCVQPLCDSVRLTKKVRIPFLPYHQVTEKPFDLVIEQQDDEGLLRLRLLVKPSCIKHVKFRPDPGARAILATSVDEGSVFLDAQGRSWKLVCRLKAAHAHRVAQSDRRCRKALTSNGTSGHAEGVRGRAAVPLSCRCGTPDDRLKRTLLISAQIVPNARSVRLAQATRAAGWPPCPRSPSRGSPSALRHWPLARREPPDAVSAKGRRSKL